jgi:hypothetical protein
MLAHRLTTILPDMTLADAPETTRIHRVAGLMGVARRAVEVGTGGDQPPVPLRRSGLRRWSACLLLPVMLHDHLDRGTDFLGVGHGPLGEVLL